MISQKAGERIIIGIFIAVVLFLLATAGGGGDPGGRSIDYDEEQLSTDSP